MDYLNGAFWSTAFADSEEFVFVLDRERRVRAVSAALARALGHEPADLVGMVCAELMHPGGVVPAVCPLAELLIDGRAHHADVHSDVLQRDLFVTVTPLPDHAGEIVGAVHTAFDMTERRRVENRLRDSEANLRSLMENISELIGRFDLGLRCRYASPAIESWLGLKPAELLDKRLLEIGFPAEVAELLEDALKRAIGERRAVDVEYSLPHADGSGRAFLEARAYPELDGDGEVVSVVTVTRDVTDRVTTEAALRERERRLESALSDTVAALGATVAQRDPYTAGHEVRAAELACLIAQRLGWDEVAVAALRTAALVHDVGKISIPAEILSKPTRLTALEFELIKGHPQAAYDILAPIAFDDHIAEVALQHHERLDGSGYPAGLRDGAILPAARVLAVADVVEAMVSHRPYRPALPAAEAIAEIRDGAGTRYDALVARACLRLLEDEGFVFSAS